MPSSLSTQTTTSEFPAAVHLFVFNLLYSSSYICSRVSSELPDNDAKLHEIELRCNWTIRFLNEHRGSLDCNSGPSRDKQCPTTHLRGRLSLGWSISLAPLTQRNFETHFDRHNKRRSSMASVHSQKKNLSRAVELTASFCFFTMFSHSTSVNIFSEMMLNSAYNAWQARLWVFEFCRCLSMTTSQDYAFTNSNQRRTCLWQHACLALKSSSRRHHWSITVATSNIMVWFWLWSETFSECLDHNRFWDFGTYSWCRADWSLSVYKHQCLTMTELKLQK